MLSTILIINTPFSLPKKLTNPKKEIEKWLNVKLFLIKSVTFGSMTWATPSVPSNLSSAFNNTCHALDFPLPLGPTIIRPWWRFVIWNSCRTYKRKDTGFMLNLRKLEMQECISIPHVTNAVKYQKYIHFFWFFLKKYSIFTVKGVKI